MSSPNFRQNKIKPVFNDVSIIDEELPRPAESVSISKQISNKNKINSALISVDSSKLTIDEKNHPVD